MIQSKVLYAVHDRFGACFGLKLRNNSIVARMIQSKVLYAEPIDLVDV